MCGRIRNELILIKQKRYFLFFNLVVSILLSFLWILFFLGSPPILVCHDDGLSFNFVAFFFMLIGLFMMLIYSRDCFILIRDVLYPKVVFAYHRDGFYLRNGEFFVPWSDVSKVVILRVLDKYNIRYKDEVIALKFKNEDMFIRSLSAFDKFIYFLKNRIYGYGVWICFKATEANPTEVFSIFMRKCPQAVCIR